MMPIFQVHILPALPTEPPSPPACPRMRKHPKKTIEQTDPRLYNTSNGSCLTDEKEEIVMGPGISTKYAKRVLAALVVLLVIAVIAIVKR